MEQSWLVSGKGRIRARIEKLSRRVPEKGRICVSIEKWQNPGKYREKGRFCARIEKLSRRVPEMDRICVSIEK